MGAKFVGYYQHEGPAPNGVLHAMFPSHHSPRAYGLDASAQRIWEYESLLYGDDAMKDALDVWLVFSKVYAAVYAARLAELRERTARTVSIELPEGVSLDTFKRTIDWSLEELRQNSLFNHVNPDEVSLDNETYDEQVEALQAAIKQAKQD